ncbi:beta-ketoacyl synthase N-terminal-like domain-containing protein [Streptomyces geranii]|uniref:beta-ketoacyl synthase N-terminal-like domain-containing protein n=1 Tax=Streptomyces geranii TaxID=2058923 RepID=UPI000D029AC7|nr:beta-ketoacyl synthase N-terminal-like domain-containing protein [Streptomyces geranii]
MSGTKGATRTKDTSGIVITGTGVITAAGTGPGPVLDAMLSGTTLFADRPEHAWLPWPLADMGLPGIPWPEGDTWANNQKYASATAHAAVAAARLALAEAGGAENHEEAIRCGTVVATGMGGGDELTEVIPKLAVKAETDPRPLAKLLYDEVPDYTYLRGIPSQIGQFVCMAAGFLGSNLAMYGESGASGLGTLAAAMRLLRAGELDRVLVVGVQPPLSAIVLAALDSEEAIGTNAGSGAGPFDLDRAGILLGEGAAALMVERAEVARARGARVVAEVAACETLCAADRTSALDGAVSAVLEEAGRRPDLWWAHGSGSVASDLDECRTVGRFAAGVPVTSSKGTIGNTFECAGLIDVVLAIEALDRELVPPVGLLRKPDPALGELDFVHGAARPVARTGSALVTTFGPTPRSTTGGAAMLTRGSQ